MNIRNCLLGRLPGIVLVLSAPWAAAQGGLAPLGGPAPVMKTLDEVEARIPLNSVRTPGTAADLFAVTSPGSYYLTTNAYAGATQNGIFILASDVVIDLNGFTLNGAGNGIGIHAGPDVSRIQVRSGAVAGFPSAINFWSTGLFTNVLVEDVVAVGTGTNGYGLAGGSYFNVRRCHVTGFGGTAGSGGIMGRDHCVVEDCRIDNCATFAIYINSYARVRNCIASGAGVAAPAFGISADSFSSIENCHVDNFGMVGIFASAGSRIMDCVASSCGISNYSAGIAAYYGCVVERCTVSQGYLGIKTAEGCVIQGCAASGTAGFGILSGNGCFITGSTCVYGNTNGIVAGSECIIRDCTSTANTGSGIAAGSRCSITGCIAAGNVRDGIVAQGDSLLTGNHASANGSYVAAVAGIRTTGGGSRIEGNQVRDNVGTGILSLTTDLILRNSVNGNNTNFFPGTGANFAPVQPPATATSPVAGFAN